MFKTAIFAATAVFLSITATFAEQARVWGSVGSQIDPSATEGQLRYMAEPLFWNLQPVLGVSMASNGAAWIGAGSAYTWRPNQDGPFVRFTSMIGVHKRGNGPNLGGPVQFRNALDLGIAATNGMEYGVGVDHRSNAGLYRPNPGMNTAYLFASFPLR